MNWKTPEQEIARKCNAPIVPCRGSLKSCHGSNRTGRLARIPGLVFLLPMIFCLSHYALGGTELSIGPASVLVGNAMVGSGRSHSIKLTNAGMAALPGSGTVPNISLSIASVSFATQIVGTTSTSKTVTLSNSGGGSLSITRITFTGLNPKDFAQSNNCGSSVAAGKRCNFLVTFTPSAKGNRSASLNVFDNASGSPQVVALTGPGTAPQITLSPTSLSFGNVQLNDTSTLPVVVTNTGATSVSLTQLSVTGTGFKTGGLLLPFVVSAGKKTTFNVSFTPTAAGSATGKVTLVNSSSSSPIVVTLSGTGMKETSGNSGCTGTTITQTPANVTSKLSSVGEGITVTQITINGTSWNTYADIPTFSSPTNLIIYNYGSNPAAVASANLDGTGAQVISGNAQGTEVAVTVDGQFAYYQGQDSNQRADIYAVPLAPSGTCEQVRLTELSLNFVAPAAALVISPSSIDPATQHNVIAYSEGKILRRVEDNGLALPDLTLPDPENIDVFHRLRLNPVFSNILWYKRDEPLPNPSGVALPEIWVIDLNKPTVVYSLMGGDASNPGVDHASWSHDGTKLGFIYGGYWWVSTVVNTDGTLNLVNGKIPLPSGWTTNTPFGPPRSSGFTVDYCNLSPDGSVYVCAQGSTAIYLMSLDGTETKFLANPDSNAAEAIFNGIPKPRFLDMEHIIFSSDRTGTPEVYVLTGFTTTFP